MNTVLEGTQQPANTAPDPNKQPEKPAETAQIAPLVATPQPKAEVATVDNRPLEIQKFEFQQRCARLFAMSGLFQDIKGQSEQQAIAQAFVKIALGDSMGFNPSEAMTGIDIIQGRVSVGANLRAARMQRAGFTWDILQLDDKGCRLRLKFGGKPLVSEVLEGDKIVEVPTVVSFMAEDAARAGLIGKDNYKKNPRNMFFARAITNAQRWYAPGVLGVDILSTEEAIDMEPVVESTQDERLAAKSTSRLEEIKQRHAQPSSTPQSNEAPADPPSPPVETTVSSETPEAQGGTPHSEPHQASRKRGGRTQSNEQPGLLPESGK
jgi:hypothetical protein